VSETTPENADDRRAFLAKISGAAMAGGLALGYGGCAAMGVRYLYPARPRALSWQFLARVGRLRVGDSLPWRSPTGERIAVARLADAGAAEDFVALSSTCPHLGCQVHWEAHNDRFFCPCHNGVFTPEGKAVAGRPADAGQSLLQSTLKVENRPLFVQAPQDQLSSVPAAGPCQG
jgi:nitrite reductase/ring-hydroxylating ferredoxin subunit